ncbi:MAG TPA: hypothetical protein VFB82_14485 [Blastocatellia bacterium]|nr:hypothetical protein [Blastocatellia bacterium]
MNELFVMRRANGSLFAQEVDGKLRIPIWANEEAVLRYRERNPELGVYLPQRFNRALLKSPAVSSASETAPEFFLLSDEASDADLADGRQVSLEEALRADEADAQSARAQA